MAQNRTVKQHKYPDEIEVDGGKVVRLSQLSDNAVIRVHKHPIRVGDIPLTAAQLTCGHVIRGIALKEQDVVFCEDHAQNSFVAMILS